MPKTFTASDWYWIADDGRVFASARGTVVGKDDAGLATFISDGTHATRWPRDDNGAQTASALDDVLRPHGLSSSGPVRSVPTYLLMRVFTDAERAAYVNAKPWDQRLFNARDTPWPENNEKIGRIAAVVGTTPRAWYDRVFGVTPASAATASTTGTAAGATAAAS